jgi:hypothetical protein
VEVFVLVKEEGRILAAPIVVGSGIHLLLLCMPAKDKFGPNVRHDRYVEGAFKSYRFEVEKSMLMPRF